MAILKFTLPKAPFPIKSMLRWCQKNLFVYCTLSEAPAIHSCKITFSKMFDASIFQSSWFSCSTVNYQELFGISSELSSHAQPTNCSDITSTGRYYTLTEPPIVCDSQTTRHRNNYQPSQTSSISCLIP